MRKHGQQDRFGTFPPAHKINLMNQVTTIAHQRLLSQRLTSAKCERPADVVRWMGAVQAQDYRQATWAIGLRTRLPALAAVEQALATREIVLTWPMRGTLHAVPAEDAAWMLRLLTPRVLKASGRRLQQLELDQATVERSKTIFYEALGGGKCLTRAAMMHLLERAGISTQHQRGYHLLWRAAQGGVICFGPRQAQHQTFVLLDEWVPAPRLLSTEAALAELTSRYFASHGPATLADFATWTGLTLATARQGLEAVQSQLIAEKLTGRTCWRTSTLPDYGIPAAPAVQLLPGFDEYLLGYQDRRDVLAAGQAANIVPGGNGIIKPMIVAEGQITGTWKPVRRRGAVDICVRFFQPVRELPAELQAAAEQHGDFLGLPVGTVTME